MAAMMDLVAGDGREILLVLAADDLDPFGDLARFPAHLSLGAGVDPTWLDLFSEAARTITGLADPIDFLDARADVPESAAAARTVERVDGAWVSAVAALPAGSLDAIAGRWLDLLREEDQGSIDADEKPWIRELVGRLVAFARAADGADEVLFAWSI
jgi:hypothetical protein